MRVSVLILAGQREGIVDPLCAEAGVERKAILPINGKPMVNYVPVSYTHLTLPTKA